MVYTDPTSECGNALAVMIYPHSGTLLLFRDHTALLGPGAEFCELVIKTQTFISF